MSGSLYQQKYKLTSYIDLRTKNGDLLKENAKLKFQLGIGVESNPLLDTSFSRVIVEDSMKQTIHYNYLPARVLNNTVDKKNNFITLNLGRKHGIAKNMNVVGPKGVVGKITHVSDNYSLAASVLSTEFSVSATTSNGTLSKVAWEGFGSPYHAVLSGIPESEELKRGDTVLTSGFSQFPPNLMVGRIVGKLKGGTTGGGRYKIQLSTNFRKLDFVYIIKDLRDIERTILEDSVKSIREGNE